MKFPAACWMFFSLCLVIASSALAGCAITIPNTRACAVAGVMEAGMDCFDTLDNQEFHIEPEKIRDFLEAQPEVRDSKGKVLQKERGAAICQSLQDFGLEHAALEAACLKLGAACTQDIRQIVDDITLKVDRITHPAHGGAK